MENVKQTGLLYEFNPNDYRVGASPLVPLILNPSGDWRDWKPLDEKQYKDYTFDTLSCATFSALNVLETTVNFLMWNDKITLDKLEWLNKNGYIVDGKLNLSDRFTAIMSGTTNLGNYMPKVWDSIRKDGVLPEADLPFGGNNQVEYLDAGLITQAMKNKAKGFLDIIECAYEWTSIRPEDIDIALKQCPLHIAVYSGSHAVELIEKDHMFDTYPPFLAPLIPPITFALKGIAKPKATIQRTLKLGMSGADVKVLQNDLKTLGYFVYPTTTTYFGNVTNKAVKDLQRANGLVSDGIVGAKTYAKIAELKKNSKNWNLLPKVEILANRLLVECAKQGMSLKITSGFRSKADQDELYAQGRTKAGKIVTNAPYPQSLHNHGLAFDICFTGANPYPSDDRLWKKIADTGVKLGLTSGYYFTSFKDRPHFEYKGNYKYADIFAFNYDKINFE